MSKPLISIIVPVYNVREYLDTCLDSISNQTYENLEILVVDDGSTDGSSELCDLWQKKDERIRIIHKNNGGLSSARNIGLDNALGEYVYFVDGDDYINYRCIDQLYSAISKVDGDIAVCEVLDVKEDYCDQLQSNSRPKEEVFSGRDACFRLGTSDNYNIGVVVWNKLYKMSLWQEIRFPEKIIHEDEAVIYQIVYPASLVVYVHSKLHYYRLRGESIMRDKFSKNRFDILKALKKRLFFLKDKDKELLLKNQLAYLHFLVYYRYLGKKYKILANDEIFWIDREIREVYSLMEMHNFRAIIMRYLPALYAIMVKMKHKG